MASLTNLEKELDCYTQDLSMLFREFDKKGSLRFEDFCDVWRELNFSFIHCGQKTVNQKVKATTRLFRCITGFLNPETTFQYRIAAIYAAYSVYYTQLARPRIKIRMTVTMWKDLKDLHELVKSHQHLDIDYIITKLENDKVFHFTAMPKLLEYGRRELMTNMQSSGCEVNIERKFYQPDQYVQELVQGFDVIEKLSSVDDEYNNMKDEIKKSLGSDVKPRILSSLDVVNEDFRSELVDDIENFREWLESNTRAQVLFDRSQRPVAKSLKLHEKKDNESTVETSSETLKLKTPSRSERIKALKQKSFRQGAQDKNDSDTCPDEGVSQPKKGRHSTQTYYRRSAIIEKLEARPWKASWKCHTKKNISNAQVSTADENI